MTTLLARLTSTPPSSDATDAAPAPAFSLPILLIGGEPVDISAASGSGAVGSALGERATVKALVESGELRRRVVDAGAVVGEGKRKKGKGK